MGTEYQNKLRTVTGAMGPDPSDSAYWAKIGLVEGNPALLSSQPLFYAPGLGSKYVTAFDQSASWNPWAKSFGKNKSKKIISSNIKAKMSMSIKKSLNKMLKNLKKMVSKKKMSSRRSKRSHRSSRKHGKRSFGRRKHRRSHRSLFGRRRKHSKRSRSFGRKHRKHSKRSRRSSRSFGRRRKHRRHFGIGQGRPDTFGMMGPF